MVQTFRPVRIHYDQPEGAPLPRERYSGRASQAVGVPSKARKRLTHRIRN
jgi:hypothetical protein